MKEKNKKRFHRLFHLAAAGGLALLYAGDQARAGQIQEKPAVYLGIVNYGNVTIEQKDEFLYRFWSEDREICYKIKDDTGECVLQNQLQEGKRYLLHIENGSITELCREEETASGKIDYAEQNVVVIDGKERNIKKSADIVRIIANAGGCRVERVEKLYAGNYVRIYGNPAEYLEVYEPIKKIDSPASCVPGKKTVKNFLLTALQPVGRTLYVYGGAWNWQDDGSAEQAVCIGVPECWTDFYAAQTDLFHYKNTDKTKSYYPFGGFNEYYYLGADCSGYVGWCIYNVMNDQDNREGYVIRAGNMAKKLAEQYGFGTWSRKDADKAETFLPGDIFSIEGHVWICVGSCPDGSLVILHSTPSESRTGAYGGGVQLTGVGPENCEAWKLADKYMKKYYPDWDQRYGAVVKEFARYTSLSGEEAGRFSWHIGSSGLEDPDGIRDQSAGDVLRMLFDERTETGRE